MRRGRSEDNGGCAFVVMLAIWSFGLWIAASLFQYVLWSFVARDVPWYADLLGGIVTNAFIIPVAIVTWILRLAGIEVPFFNI